MSKASSGFSASAVRSNSFHSSGSNYGNLAADDFTIPGTGTHKITAVYAPGMNLASYEPSSMGVTFYDKLKYSGKSGITTVVVKARSPKRRSRM